MEDLKEMKICSKCKIEKPLDEFSLNRLAKDGHYAWCKECQRFYDRTRRMTREVHEKENKRNRERRQNPEWLRGELAYMREYNQRPEVLKKRLEWFKNNPEQVLLTHAKSRATKLKIPFSLRLEDIVIPDICPILGIPLLRGGMTDERDLFPSLDRIIPSLGYVVGNTAVISLRANRIKYNGSDVEHIQIAEWMEKPLQKMEGSFEKEATQKMVSQARKRAKKKGIECTIVASDLLIPTICPVLGLEINFGRGLFHDGSPSLDRFDNSKGYSVSNVSVISNRANTIKSDGTADEHRKIADWIIRMTKLEEGEK